MKTSESAGTASGFTLLEVLVALVIVGLGLIAVFNQVSQSLVAASLMRERTLAHWVAMNQLAELRLSGELPEVGERSDEVEMAGTEWSYVLTFSDFGFDNIRQVDVSVSLADQPDRVITELKGIVAKPPGKGLDPPRWPPASPDADTGQSATGGELQ